MAAATWMGIAICIVHSAMFSGLNLALFGLTRLRLEVEAATGDTYAARILRVRRDPHFLLTTILWGNVAFNTLLAILSNSVMAGVVAFVFSTFFITFFGEIIPQAYFSRHALRMGSILAPVIRFYQLILYPVAKPSAMLLDKWLGLEGIRYFREHQLREVIQRHIEADEADVDMLEGLGALNFLALDDLLVAHEGEPLDPASVVKMPFAGKSLTFPPISHSQSDPFLKSIQQSGKKWIILTDDTDRPRYVLDADGFLRSALFEPETFSPLQHCHRPIIVTNDKMPLGDILHRLKVKPESAEDDVVDQDIILLWGAKKRVITGADILGRLLRGIVVREEIGSSKDTAR